LGLKLDAVGQDLVDRLAASVRRAEHHHEASTPAGRLRFTHLQMAARLAVWTSTPGPHRGRIVGAASLPGLVRAYSEVSGLWRAPSRHQLRVTRPPSNASFKAGVRHRWT